MSIDSIIDKKVIRLSTLSSSESRIFDTPADCAEALSNGTWLRYRHLDYISSKIAEIKASKLRLIVSLPPGHGKSELISHWLPVWFLHEWPEKRIGFATYEAIFAAYWGGLARKWLR